MLSINPNQNSTKAIKGSEKTLRWEILENKIPKHIFNILKKKFINLSQSYKKEQKSPKRERERILTIFLWEKYGLNGKNNIKFIQNKMEKRRVKIYKRENEEESVTVKLRVVGR